MRSTFKLLFYINRQKTKKNGRCPIMGRVTIDGSNRTCGILKPAEPCREVNGWRTFLPKQRTR